MTGAQIKRTHRFIANCAFYLTNGKDFESLISITPARPAGVFGIIEKNNFNSVLEKPGAEAGWINDGFWPAMHSFGKHQIPDVLWASHEAPTRVLS